MEICKYRFFSISVSNFNFCEVILVQELKLPYSIVLAKFHIKDLYLSEEIMF